MKPLDVFLLVLFAGLVDGPSYAARRPNLHAGRRGADQGPWLRSFAHQKSFLKTCLKLLLTYFLDGPCARMQWTLSGGRRTQLMF